MSITFNGSNQYLRYNAAQIGSLVNASAQTMCGWFNLNATNAVYGIFHQINAADQTSVLSGVVAWSNADFRPYSSGGRGTEFGASVAGQWVFLAWWCDGSGNTGAASAATGLTTTGNFSTSTTGTSGSVAFNDFQIGREGSNGNYFAGSACCVRIFTGVLSLSELLSEARSATPVKTGSVLANWRMATASDLTDTVGSRTFTAFNTPTTGSTEPNDISGSSVAPIAAYYISLRANE